MANTIIQIKSSGAIGNVPSTLAPGELAINYADGKLYYGNTSCTAILFDAVTDPAGLNQEIQFNDSGVFGSSANLKFDSSTKTLTTKNVSISVGGSITFPDNTVQNTAWTGTSGSSIDQVARSIANSAFDQANLAYNQANVGGGGSGNSFGIFSTTDYPDIVANTSSQRVTFVAQTGIAIGLDPVNSVVSIATNLIGASNVTIDYGYVSDILGAVTFDYGDLI